MTLAHFAFFFFDGMGGEAADDFLAVRRYRMGGIARANRRRKRR